MSVLTAHPSAPAAATTPVKVRAAGQLRNAAVLPVLCSLSAEPIRSCQVTATALVDGRVQVVGRGSAHLDGRPSAHKVAVGVEFNEVGRQIAEATAGVFLTIEAVVQGVDSRSFATSSAHRLLGPA